MKRLLLILLLLPVCVAQNAYAQGWEWAKGAVGNESEATFCATDASGNIYGAGYFFGETSFEHDTLRTNISGLGIMLLVKYSSTGTVLWASAPDIGLSYADGIATDLFEHVYVLGVYDTFFRLNGHTLSNPYPVSTTNFLAKYDSAGNIIWLKNIGNIAAGNNWASTSIATDAYGNIYLTSSYYSNGRIGVDSFTNHGGTADIFLSKLDSSGNPIWTKTFGGSGMDITTGIAVTPTGSNIYIAGYFDSDTLAFGSTILTDTSSIPHYYGMFLTKLDNLGNSIWSRGSGTVQPYGPMRGVAIDSSEDIFITGSYSLYPINFGAFTLPQSGTGLKGFLVKYSSLGNVEWAKAMQGPSVAPYSVSYDNCGNSVWIVGSIYRVGNDTIDGHILSPPLMSTEPSFIAGWYPDGTYIRASSIQTDGYSTIACDGLGNIGICGDGEQDTLILANDTLTNMNEHVFVAKYNIWRDCATSSVANHTPIGDEIMIYPNPAITQIIIQSLNKSLNSISIYNFLGQAMYAQHYNALKVEIDVSALPVGVYLIRINGTEVRKFVKL